MPDRPNVSDEKVFSFFSDDHAYPSKDDPYQAHLIEQYKVYVATVDKISDRRQAANSYFLTVNSALLAFVGYAIPTNNSTIPANNSTYLWLLGLAGMCSSYLWYRIVRSYRDLNSGKFAVIQTIERRLPLRAFEAEWATLGEGKNPKLYKPITNVEIGVPWMFFVLHAFVVVRTLPWQTIHAYLFP